MHSTERPLSLARRNCLNRVSEAWRPPAFGCLTTVFGRIIERVRRFLDLQYASIYGDMRVLIANMSGQVLDVGCGAQPFRHLLGSDCTYRGIDTSAALGDFGYRIPDTTYFDGDRWPVDDASVDFVLSTETLEHVPDSAGFLNEAFRCVRRGGQVVLTVPFSARWHYIPHDYWRFTPSALDRLLTNAGFCDVRVYARGNSVTVAVYKSMSVILTAAVGKRSTSRTIDIERVAGGVLLPLLPVLAIAGQLSLLGEGGDDCLGYTVVARRPDAQIESE